MAEAGMRSPHNLEVYPTQADRFQLGSDVIFEQGRPPERLASLTRKHVRFGILAHRLLHPIAKQRGSRGSDRDCSDQTVLWSRELPSIHAPTVLLQMRWPAQNGSGAAKPPLRGDAKDPGNECDLPEQIVLCQPPHLSFADHVHCLVSRDRVQRATDRSEPKARRD